MATRTLGISEARRLLPELVRSVAKDGGRVDITYRGRTQVSLLRLADVRGSRTPGAPHGEVDPSLRVVLKVPDQDLVKVIRQLRAVQGHARTGWLGAAGRAGAGQATSRRRRRAAK